MNNILEVTGLNKSYGDFSLSNVTFSLPEDCITGFIGVNGAGKTTTLRSILRLTINTSGTIKLFGLDMEKHERELKNRIGVVLDDGGFYDELTMSEMENVIAPAYSSWSEEDYKSYMNRFSLNPKQKTTRFQKACG
jgi:ABC-2 type transport system ATP-binding protein